MTNRFAKLFVVAILVVLIAAFPRNAHSAVSESAINLVVLESEGLSFQVFDANYMDYYSFSSFTDSITDRPARLDRSILITRYVPTDDVYIKAYDQLIYYPSVDGSGGHVYYVGKMGEPTEFDNQWYRGNPEAEAMIQSTFNQYEKDLSHLVYAAVAALGGLIFIVLRNVR